MAPAWSPRTLEQISHHWHHWHHWHAPLSTLLSALALQSRQLITHNSLLTWTSTTLTLSHHTAFWMARKEHFKSCHYSFLNRMLQPFQKHHSSSQATLQVNALVEGKSKKNDKLFSKSTVDLNSLDPRKEERMSMRQIGQYLADVPSQSLLNHPTSINTITRPRITGVCVCVFTNFFISHLKFSTLTLTVINFFIALLIILSFYIYS